MFVKYNQMKTALSKLYRQSVVVSRILHNDYIFWAVTSICRLCKQIVTYVTKFHGNATVVDCSQLGENAIGS